MRIERDLGPRVGVLVLGAVDMLHVATANPFLGGDAGPTGSDEKSLHATFLFGSGGDADFGEASESAYSAVYEAAFGKLELPADEGEEAAFVGVPPLATPVVYLRLPHGYGRTKLNNAYFERKLGSAATTRNWRTVLALAELATGEGVSARAVRSKAAAPPGDHALSPATPSCPRSSSAGPAAPRAVPSPR